MFSVLLSPGLIQSCNSIHYGIRLQHRCEGGAPMKDLFVRGIKKQTGILKMNRMSQPEKDYWKLRWQQELVLLMWKVFCSGKLIFFWAEWSELKRLTTYTHTLQTNKTKWTLLFKLEKYNGNQPKWKCNADFR